MQSLPGSVMLVDDDLDDHEILCLALESVSPSIACLYYDSAQKALDHLIQNAVAHPDYIFLDLNLPGMNGMQFLEALKKDESCNAIPVIAYSTSILPSDKEKVLQLGAEYFFIKPSSHKELIEELKVIFNTFKRQSVSL